jgi:adenosylhomocysteine nucleosidase
MPHDWLLRDRLLSPSRQSLAEWSSSGSGGDPGELEAWTCDVGLVFAVEQESGGLLDLMTRKVTLRGEGFEALHGELGQRRLTVFHSGAGREAASRAAEALILGHRPALVISAGFAGGLQPVLARYDLVLADSLVDGDGNVVPLDTLIDPAELTSAFHLHVGRLLTVDRVVSAPEDKTALGEKHQALAVDMESCDVARICNSRRIPFFALRIITDALSDRLPPDVERLARQKTVAARWGAAIGALFRRPSSLKDMWALQETALQATDRLAAALAQIINPKPKGSNEQSR